MEKTQTKGKVADDQLPVLHMRVKRNGSRQWRKADKLKMFALSNLGTTGRLLINQLISVALSLSSTTSLLPVLTTTSLGALCDQAEYESEKLWDGMPGEGRPYIAAFDISSRKPDVTEMAFVCEVLMVIRQEQAVPHISASIIVRMLAKALRTVEAEAEKLECLDEYLDKNGKAMWAGNSEVAIRYGLTHASTDYWEALQLLKDSMLAYAIDLKQTLDDD